MGNSATQVGVSKQSVGWEFRKTGLTRRLAGREIALREEHLAKGWFGKERCRAGDSE